MDKLPLISVIVPVYKVEAYLDKCVSSVAEQTYNNLEIILVDDGSPDNSPAMCDAWAEKDNRVRVIHQKNAGGGAARNAALDIAQGNLIAFVDSDDYIAPDMYTHLFSLLDQGADIAECGHINVTDDAAVFQECGSKAQKYTVEEAMHLHIQDTAFRQLIWNKLYRREVIGDIRFPEGKKIDDEFFTYQVIGNADTLIRSDRICYAYRQQANSVMHSMNLKKRLEAVAAKELRHNYILKYFPTLTGESLKNLWFTCIYQGQLAINNLCGSEAKDSLNYLSEVLKKHPYSGKDFDACGIKDRIWILMAHFSIKWTCKFRNLIKVGI